MGFEAIQFQDPQEIPDLQKQKGELAELLADLPVDSLRSTYKALFGKPAAAKNKDELVHQTADALIFPTGEAFQAWFCTLPDLTQHILYRAAYEDYVPIACFVKEYGTYILIQDSYYAGQPKWRFNPSLGLDFLSPAIHYGCPVIALPRVLRIPLLIWLAPPPPIHLTECQVPLPVLKDIAHPWNNSLPIADTFPLLCNALGTILEDIPEEDRERILRGGFKKKDLKELRTATGFLPFRLRGDYAPDSLDLTARFILCIYNFIPHRPEDGHDGVRNLVEFFFSKESRYPQKWYAPDRNYLEYTLCIDHFSRTAGYYLEHTKDLPASRRIFQELLGEIAQDGGCFDADKLAEYIRITRKQFAFCDLSLEKTLKIKAETLEINGVCYSNTLSDGFHPEGILRFDLLVKPLFKAYCYIFAALGLLEITQEMPPPSRNYREKRYPLSPYDSLKTIRITEFGRWCLGLSSLRPPRPPREYQAIADRELFLVTVQGNSLERQVYLNKIGQKLGENRWRISPGSFIAGCNHQRQIMERIELFKSLIDPHPAPHWEQLFQKVLTRAGLFDVSRSDMLVYDLPKDQEILDELLRDPELKSLARRTEGRMLVVASRDQRKFFALLSEHGIAHF